MGCATLHCIKGEKTEFEVERENWSGTWVGKSDPENVLLPEWMRDI